MMFRVVARNFFSLGLTASLCFAAAAQTAPIKGTAGVAPGLSSSADSQSNDVASLYGSPVEQVVARVNDQVITNSDVTRAQQMLDQEAHQNNWSLNEYNRNEKNLLRDLIDQQLLLSKGKELGLTGDTELIKRLDEIRKQNHLESLEDLEKAVEQQGLSYEDFKANIRNSIITQQVVRNEVGSKLQISEAQIEKYYNEHKDSFTQPESVHLNEILIPTSENASSSELATAEAKANEVEAKLQAGGNFADLAKTYSGGPTAKQGGDLGQFRRGALAKVLEDQTFDLSAGGYTKPIRTKQGYIILQVSEHTPGGTAPLQKVEPQIEQALYIQMIEPAVRTYLTRLRDEAYIDIRPGYTDSAASPNQTKPTFAAYVPPQPKKKKKKNRFDRRDVRYRISDKRKAASVGSTTATVPGATDSTAGATTDVSSASPTVSPAASAQAEKKSTEKASLRKSKREKLRFGRAPHTSIAEEQVPSAATSGDHGTTPTQVAAAGQIAANPDIQPLGQDLEHTPTITQPPKTKTRFSDRKKAEAKPKKGQKKVKKVKQDNTKPTALSSSEVANQQVQSAPLGLAGATADKKKKKKIKVKNGEKIRLSDEKKDNDKNTQSQPPDQTSPTPSSSGNGNPPSPSPAANSPTHPPQ